MLVSEQGTWILDAAFRAADGLNTVSAQAIQMVQLGRSSMADQIFRLLACERRLSDALLSFSANTGKGKESRLAQSSACILSPAVPGGLVLRSAVKMSR